ncbi:MAG: hypothetical protein WC102_01560 [Saccharofermentanales bacterium]
MEDMIYTPSIGEKITCTIANMHAAAIANDCTVKAVFNDYELVITPTTDPTEILHKYNVDMAVREVEYRGSPEYKQRQEELTQQKEVQKRKIELLCKHYPDFNDLDAVVTWLEHASECNIISLKPYGIVEKFELEGYEINTNCYDKFDINSKDNFGKWLVGQALNGIKTVGSIHPIFKNHAQQWRDRFGVL